MADAEDARDTPMLRRKRAYKRLFPMVGGVLTADAKAVLGDLKRFADLPNPPVAIAKGTGAVDPIASAIKIGRQEVVNRILSQIHTDDATLFNLKEDHDQ